MIQLRRGIRERLHRALDGSIPAYLQPPTPSRVYLDRTWRTAAELVREQRCDHQADAASFGTAA